MKTVAVIGAGNVGAQVVAAGIAAQVPVRFLLVDTNEELEAAQVLDLKDSQLLSSITSVAGADFSSPELTDVDVVIITAGAKQQPGENRCALLDRNAEIVKSIAQNLPTLKPEAIVMLITNPVDVLTHIASTIFDLPPGHVFGTGTLLDSTRLRWRLSERLAKPLSQVEGIVMGEHGDSEFVAWSTVSPAVDELSDTEKGDIETSVREAAYKIIEGKGATFFGIGAAAITLLDAVVSDTNVTLPVSAPLDGEYGLSAIAIGVPAIIGANGIESIVELPLPPDELAKLHQSAQKLTSLYEECPLTL